MQHYHLDMEGIPKYINTLEDAQRQPKRAGNPITADTLLLIAYNSMPSSERFPQEDKIWEELTKRKKDWDA